MLSTLRPASGVFSRKWKQLVFQLIGEILNLIPKRLSVGDAVAPVGSSVQASVFIADACQTSIPALVADPRVAVAAFHFR